MSTRLVEGGLAEETPCAIISQIACEGERVHRTTLRELADAPRLPSPTILFVGEVVRLAVHASLEPNWWLGHLDEVAGETQSPAGVPLMAQRLKGERK